MADRLAVGVLGGTGYAGGELCRLLLNHPFVGSVHPSSRTDAPFERVHRNLAGSGLAFVSPDALVDGDVDLDVVFFATPTGEAMAAAGAFLDRGTRVVDLSADFRFPDPAAFATAHGRPHAAPDLLDRAVTNGITEHNRHEVRGAALVANPGCYVVTAALGLAPLLASGLADTARTVHVAAVNGTTGAGSTPRRPILHAEADGAMLAYDLAGHRHADELVLRLAEAGAGVVDVDLGTSHGSFPRGIHVQASVAIAPEHRDTLTRDDVLALYRDHYGAGHAGEFFVLVNDHPALLARGTKEYDLFPTVRAVQGSNFCHVGLDVDRRAGRVRVVAVTDNLVKGAAGSAIQNMNVMLGHDETAGLRGYGL